MPHNEAGYMNQKNLEMTSKHEQDQQLSSSCSQWSVLFSLTVGSALRWLGLFNDEMFPSFQVGRVNLRQEHGGFGLLQGGFPC